MLLVNHFLQLHLKTNSSTILLCMIILTNSCKKSVNFSDKFVRGCFISAREVGRLSSLATLSTLSPVYTIKIINYVCTKE